MNEELDVACDGKEELQSDNQVTVLRVRGLPLQKEGNERWVEEFNVERPDGGVSHWVFRSMIDNVVDGA